MARSLLVAWLLLFSAFACSTARRPPNVLLVTLDTTRVDHVSVYGATSARRVLISSWRTTPSATPGLSRRPAGGGPVLAEVNPISAGAKDGGWRATWEGPLKYHHHSEGEHRLHHLERDPEERVNLLASRPADADPSLFRIRSTRIRALGACVPKP